VMWQEVPSRPVRGGDPFAKKVGVPVKVSRPRARGDLNIRNDRLPLWPTLQDYPQCKLINLGLRPHQRERPAP
jgi:hypothetical protein